MVGKTDQKPHTLIAKDCMLFQQGKAVLELLNWKHIIKSQQRPDLVFSFRTLDSHNYKLWATVLSPTCLPLQVFGNQRELQWYIYKFKKKRKKKYSTQPDTGWREMGVVFQKFALEKTTGELKTLESFQKWFRQLLLVPCVIKNIVRLFWHNSWSLLKFLYKDFWKTSLQRCLKNIKNKNKQHIKNNFLL